VAGNVAQPGAFPFRSGITIRRAIALAGDVDITGMADSSDPISQGTEVEGEARALKTDLAGLDLSLARHAAEFAALEVAGTRRCSAGESRLELKA
jgi:protein involved in polysaccharide export with SLBB domain